jgi:5-methylcytosine-specific restriction endonuclease McrA
MGETGKRRTKIPVVVQVRVLFRDGWLCHWCHRPTVFAPAMKYLEAFVKDQGYRYPLAFYDFRYRRDAAPLLDHLAAVVDHVEALSRGGAHDETNFVAACNKCNLTKSNRTVKDYVAENPGKRVKGKYGEPAHWDGFASLFLILAVANETKLLGSEREWYRALREYLDAKHIGNGKGRPDRGTPSHRVF